MPHNVLQINILVFYEKHLNTNGAGFLKWLLKSDTKKEEPAFTNESNIPPITTFHLQCFLFFLTLLILLSSIVKKFCRA